MARIDKSLFVFGGNSMAQQRLTLAIAPAQVYRGWQITAEYMPQSRTLVIASPSALGLLQTLSLPDTCRMALPVRGCTELNLAAMLAEVQKHSPTWLVGAGGGRVLDLAKLVAYRADLPLVTVPTSAATCAAWTALSNVYEESGAFAYDVPLPCAPQQLIVDYALIQKAPVRMLIAGIGDALAKWYEASVSSGHSDQTMIIAAVQTARILRDLLLQQSAEAIATPGGKPWQEVVDAVVCLAGVIGGIGGADCRTVAAHAIHNALTHHPNAHGALHGEKVAYGILVQLRLEEVHGNQLAATARQQLRELYRSLGLPQTLADLGLGHLSREEQYNLAAIACRPNSDIHRLPFTVTPTEVLEAMESTTSATTSKAAVESAS
ncbi:MAG: iron-containing alcohol dehydrogenase family protein [Oscillatoriales cyanobacterium SM2_2_1]|nr:iron-containing alcohol dehydrogenase family protein [Oscillatoriales cyanobacterium SM2_2_1]